MMSSLNGKTRGNSRALRRVFALSLALILAFGTLVPCAYAVMPTRGDLVRYIPFAVSIDDQYVQVYGYFTNLNPDCSVSNFRDFSMSVVMDNVLIASGSFGTLDSFTIGPEDVLYHNFIFEGSNGLYPGTYICDDEDVAIISCTFDYSQLVYRANGYK